LETGKIEPAKTLAAAGSTRAIECPPKLVILRSLGFVRQNLICFVQFFKLRLFSAGFVRMLFVSQFPVGFFNLVI
jgi:hypothetical protein